MRPLYRTVLFVCLLFVLPATAVAQDGCPCEVANVGGTAAPVPQCSAGWVGPLQITDGLPAGSTIEINATLDDFANVTEVAGGSLGGDIQTFDALLSLQMSGTGALAGYSRTIFIGVSGTTHTAPRFPGTAVQNFAHDMIELSGDLLGDPDFCTFQINAGSFHGLPSPGQTTLTRLGGPGTDFSVASEFDLAASITWVGCPGSILDGMSGSNESGGTFLLCETPVSNPKTSIGSLKSSWD